MDSLSQPPRLRRRLSRAALTPMTSTPPPLAGVASASASTRPGPRRGRRLRTTALQECGFFHLLVSRGGPSSSTMRSPRRPSSTKTRPTPWPSRMRGNLSLSPRLASTNRAKARPKAMRSSELQGPSRPRAVSSVSVQKGSIVKVKRVSEHKTFVIDSLPTSVPSVADHKADTSIRQIKEDESRSDHRKRGWI